MSLDIGIKVIKMILKPIQDRKPGKIESNSTLPASVSAMGQSSNNTQEQESEEENGTGAD